MSANRRFVHWDVGGGRTHVGAQAAALKLEKKQIKLGFIKLVDMAPLAIVYEKGFFEDEGLYVTLEPQANWKVIEFLEDCERQRMRAS